MVYTCSVSLNLGLHRKFQWQFIGADVKFPILGTDFLRHYGLLVDVSNNKLLDAISFLSTQGLKTQVYLISPITSRPQSKYHRILTEYQLLSRVTQDMNVKLSATHHIMTKGQPVYARPRRLSPEKLKIAPQRIQ